MAVEPKDMSRISGAPAEITGKDGRMLKFSPINPVKVCGALGRHVKSQRQDSFMELVKRQPDMSADVISSTLAKIEAQPYTMQTMMDEMQTYEGTKFILWQSLKPHSNGLKLEEVEDLVPDMVAALTMVLGLSGITVGEEDTTNPTASGGQIQPTGGS
ncbi:hypothetical protein CMI37_35810 [Candidatus Pacearchaeota archaeon]|nr:hypothetical protein [Candidatus Pacearchaeota archaeon]